MPVKTTNERNVHLCDYDGVVLAGFYQYGTVTWKSFLRWLSLLIDTPQPWVVLSGDCYASEIYSPTDDIVLPGKYTVLTSDLHPLHVKLVLAHARRQRTPPNRAKTATLHLHRSRPGLDRQCSMSEHELCWCTLQAAHLFSETHPTEWKCKRHLLRNGKESVSSSKAYAKSRAIASLPNMLLLRDDLHHPWAEYEFGVDPDDGYRITAFVAGHSAIAGRILPLNNIAGHSTRTLDQLLRDHLLQGLLKHVKGQGERHWDFSGPFDLSDTRLWGTDEAKERLELELEHRLLDLQLVQGSDNDGLPPALLPAALPSSVPVSGR